MSLVKAAMLAITLVPGAAATHAQDVGPTPTLPALAGDPGVFLLRGGTRLAGTLVERTEAGDVLELRSGERVRLAPDVLAGRVSGPEGWDGPEVEGPREVRLTTASSTVEGTLLGRSDGAVQLRTRDGRAVSVREADLVSARFLAELKVRRAEFVDPARARYLAARRAGALAAREWSARASAEAALELGYAPFDWLTVSAGVETPVLYGSPVPPAGYRLDATANLRFGPARLSAGSTASYGQGATAVVLHAEASVGAPAGDLTVFAGPPLASAARLGSFDAVVVGAAGTVKVVGPLRLLTEAWMTPRTKDPVLLGALAARMVASSFALDVGWMVSSSGAHAPWLAVTTDGRWGSR